jgi:hypothetical protein
MKSDNLNLFMKAILKIFVAIFCCISLFGCDTENATNLDYVIASNLNKRLLEFKLKGGVIPPSASTKAAIIAVNEGIATEGVSVPANYNYKPPMTITNEGFIVFDHDKQSFLYPEQLNIKQ